MTTQEWYGLGLLALYFLFALGAHGFYGWRWERRIQTHKFLDFYEAVEKKKQKS